MADAIDIVRESNWPRRLLRADSMSTISRTAET